MRRSARIQRAGNACRKINIIHARLRTNLSRHSRTRLLHDIGRFVKNVRNTTLPQSNESRIPSWIAGMHSRCLGGEMFSPATVRVERKLYRQLLQKLPRRAMGVFLSFSFSIFFHRDRHGALRDSTATRQTRVKGLKRGFTRAFLNFSADLREPREAFSNNQTVLSVCR